MAIASVIVSAVLILALIASAGGKLLRLNLQMQVMRTVGVPENLVPYLAVIELVGAGGLVVGFAVPALGIAAAIGVVLYFVGAVASHLRVGDWSLTSSGGMLVLSIAALTLSTLTA
ncbi:DoxX family protein [Acrocarpospora macrocephala]|uniref:DoxX family protein n=1 Tax=Acrocarpospora macrocephala TaxID=150177 RepID=UPI001478FB31|nr:DoxX family protein [Acrocarpospora macrocephala]